MRKSVALSGKNIPYIEAVHTGSRQRPTAILLRTSWTTGDTGAAHGIAQAWHNPNNRLDSCHYVVDNTTVIRCVPDKVEAFANKGLNKKMISINVCHDPPDPLETSAFYLAAELTARLCKLHHIPVRILDEFQEVSWIRHKWRYRGGIFLRTAGAFSTEKFFASVEDAYENL